MNTKKRNRINRVARNEAMQVAVLGRVMLVPQLSLKKISEALEVAKVKVP